MAADQPFHPRLVIQAHNLILPRTASGTLSGRSDTAPALPASSVAGGAGRTPVPSWSPGKDAGGSATVATARPPPRSPSDPPSRPPGGHGAPHPDPPNQRSIARRVPPRDAGTMERRPDRALPFPIRSLTRAPGRTPRYIL